ncbi:helix-turn-helix domain-containing protein [uncultured Nocardioides sp.]|uniref:winged helix-turn-helix domain-containing protein n=1 Tax=uncultured Nocardioides sp. TaxID=198441 RepID=UPI00260B1EE7|nr:helix-turn-helix domain-containing protein [uncultured Nocardioides sp.]
MPEQPVVDPAVLRAVSHPVRNRVLAELHAAGPLRAADVAQALDIPANQASFHLRQLAKYGLVVEAPEAARDGRDRVWKPAAYEGLHLDLTRLERTPEGRAAGDVYRRQLGATLTESVARAVRRHESERRGVTVSDAAVRLTEDEARALASEVIAVVERYAERTRGATDGAHRRTFQVLQVVQPHDQDD